LYSKLKINCLFLLIIYSKMTYRNILEEELKIRVGQDYFASFDDAKKLGKVDFCITLKNQNNQEDLFHTESLLWAEAKKGKSDIYKSIVQLILTIGKARTFDKFLPPAYLGAFDAENIAFIPYNNISDIFYINDFNWNVTSSNHETKEFLMVYDKVKTIIDTYSLLFNFDNDEKEIHQFIKNNFIVGKSETSKIRIDKNNFMVIYNKWLIAVKPTIAVNWDVAKKVGIIDGDFYLADLLSIENESIKDKLYVLLKKNYYELDRKINDFGLFSSSSTSFNDKQLAHQKFWNKYERPPNQAYWEFIAERRELLVPQDVRERKGSFFTPQIWVEKSQEYLANVLGEDWQDEYYIWDCAAGTGNLLAGLTNKYNIYASTLDIQDVNVMEDRIQTMNKNSVDGNGSNLLNDHVFQFDFLNDSFDKLPKSLQEIINNPVKRNKLVILMNPPYAEAPVREFEREGKVGVEQSKTNLKYTKELGQGNRELFVQFLTRIYFEIPNCKIAQFSTLKTISGQHFVDFRKFFFAKLEKAFVVPADTFDNVKGKFPIGFMIWDTNKKDNLEKIVVDVFDKNNVNCGTKNYYSYSNSQYINDWIKPFRADVSKNQLIGKFPFMGNDFQQQNIIQINHHKMVYNKAAGQFFINQKNVLHACIYFAVRKCIKATWLNDRDQFLFPNKKWEKDLEFQSDCLAYTLFTNNIQSKYGTNHWIQFSEKEVDAREKFESNFMSLYIAGKINIETTADLFSKAEKSIQKPIHFSDTAQAVFDAGKKLYKYYHQQKNCNVNASLYDIKEYFQGRTEAGRMNSKSEDATYSKLIKDMRETLEVLESKLKPKVYEFGFLIE
jgi:hypothetical protein